MPARLAVAALAALAIAGCGEGPTATPRDGVLSLQLAEYRIVPTKVRIRAGRVDLRVINHGILTHNVAIETDPRSGDRPSRTVMRTITLQPGARTRKIRRLAPGNYRLVCTIHNHADLGQYGELQVR